MGKRKGKENKRKGIIEDQRKRRWERKRTEDRSEEQKSIV